MARSARINPGSNFKSSQQIIRCPNFKATVLILKCPVPCTTQVKTHLTCVTRKQTLRFLSLSFSEFNSAEIIDYILEKSVSCQKKDRHGHASFFWHDNDKDLKVCFLWTRVILFTRGVVVVVEVVEVVLEVVDVVVLVVLAVVEVVVGLKK